MWNMIRLQNILSLENLVDTDDQKVLIISMHKAMINYSCSCDTLEAFVQFSRGCIWQPHYTEPEITILEAPKCGLPPNCRHNSLSLKYAPYTVQNIN